MPGRLSISARAPAAYPAGIRALTALRFLALGWVMVSHFGDHLGLGLSRKSGLMFNGYLGVDLFFVLSGFQLAQLFAREVETGAKRYASLVFRRMARLYPLHLVTTAAMGVLWLAALRLGAMPHSDVFNPTGLLANLLMVHAWGAVPVVSWNFPSWAVSAEWFALLVFPATFWLAMKGWSRAVVAVAAPLALFAAMFEMGAAHDVLFTDMTAQIGILRTIPDVLLGAGLYRLGLERGLPRGWGAGMALASLAWIIAACQLSWPDLYIWPAFGTLVFGLAETSRQSSTGMGPSILGARPLVWLGQISWAMYLVQLPVDIAYFHGVQRLIGTPSGPMVWLVWLGVFPAIGLATLIAHYGLERPLARWLDRRDPFQAKANDVLAAA
jgi:peptidoglycan/LPS O-acetylase OafA/YrhL